MTALHLTDSYIDTGAATVHVEQAGEGLPALVFLHYWGGSTRTWHPVMERLAGSVRCVAIDHRGWGRSTAPATGYAVGDLAADALAVIDALGLTDYIIVGHSMGGKVAQLLAGQRPEGLRGAVLVAPAPAKPAFIPEAVREQMAGAYASRETVAATLDSVLRHATLDDALREQVIQDSLAGAEPAKREWPRHTILEDVSGGLAQIDVPVLVVAAEQDRVEPVDVLQSHVIAEIEGAELDVIAESGHLIPLERPDALSDRIAAFRDTITRGRDKTQTTENKETVVAFYERAFNGRDPAGAVAAHAGPTYIQHNPAAPDGAEGFVAFASDFLDNYPGLRIDVVRTLAEGDSVFTHSRMTIPGSPDTALMDLWRLEAGRIVEHWDAIQPVPETAANDNTMF